MDSQALVGLVAPCLRMLLGEQGPVRVSVQPETAEAAGARTFRVSPEEDGDALVERLARELAGASPQSVLVPGVGLFVVRPAGGKGRMAGRVALVTGAAQGFGLGIAKALADEGALLALADLNAEGVEQAAAELNHTFGETRAIAVTMNVADKGSVADGVARVVRAFGGIDLLVSNAGVLRAESVMSQPERDFDLVTSVNYKGYFLCVQAVAPVMALQHRVRPDLLFDVVQVNSKSGLVGSNRNFAYAGSKFGGVGLTQSFALELVEHGIKVNAVCPGNFLDGPLWSDPVNGLFAQYLRTGKAPGAITVEDVKKAYEAKVPMRRGCRIEDVARAILYLVEQQYETGQALPVTGGQVMLG